MKKIKVFFRSFAEVNCGHGLFFTYFFKISFLLLRAHVVRIETIQ